MGLNPVFCHHAGDDPAAVVAAAEAGRWLPSGRPAFLGGEGVVEALAPHRKRQKDAELQLDLTHNLAPIRSVHAVRILADLAAKSKVKRQLPAVLAPFAEPLRPALEGLAGDPTVGAAATSLLATLSAG